MVGITNFVQLFTNPRDPNSKSNFGYITRPFQLLGFDIMLDEEMNAWLLEINMSPCIEQVVCMQQMACNHKECPISPVD